MALIGINELVRRQSERSRFSHYEGSFDELVTLVEYQFRYAAAGYRDGVLLVPVPPKGFYSGVVELTSATPLTAFFEPRATGEAPYVQVIAPGGPKSRARVVDVVVYRRDVLLEEGPDGPSTQAEWEIISINARATHDPEPPTPMAMARNFLGLPGGTRATYTAQQFAEAIVYWSTRVMRG